IRTLMVPPLSARGTIYFRQGCREFQYLLAVLRVQLHRAVFELDDAPLLIVAPDPGPRLDQGPVILADPRDIEALARWDRNDLEEARIASSERYELPVHRE